MEKKPKRGRPPKSPEEKASAVLYIKLTQAERESIESAAGRAGANVTTWVREVALRAAKRR